MKIRFDFHKDYTILSGQIHRENTALQNSVENFIALTALPIGSNGVVIYLAIGDIHRQGCAAG